MTRLATAFILILTMSGLSNPGSRDTLSPRDGPEQLRIKFDILTIEKARGENAILSHSRVEGPPGTDFTVRLNSTGFEMNAEFVTDPRPDGLMVIASLSTRRLYGMSSRNLPLYEEDSQRHRLTVGFDEDIVLLPYGRGGDAQLRIEIKPALTDNAIFRSGKRRPLQIEILETTAGAPVTVSARYRPHWFNVRAELLADDRPLSIAEGRVFIAEQSELRFRDSGETPFSLSLRVESYDRDRPADRAQVSFDLSGRDDQGNSLAIAEGWAGVLQVGSPATYPLPAGGALARTGANRLRIQLAPDKDFLDED